MKKTLLGIFLGLALVLAGCGEIKHPAPTVEKPAVEEKPEVKQVSYKDVIAFVERNITTILENTFSRQPTNGKWFASGYGFTSPNFVYVDFEDGHFLFRALLECKTATDCSALAIFEKQGEWLIRQGKDTQKDNPIVYKWAQDYEWQR